MIPNILHFVFGMAPDFGGKPFSLVHYLAVRSAIALNKPSAAYFHYAYEPVSAYWEQVKPLLTLNAVKAPEHIFGNKLYHVAHKADVVRLQALQETGGIYLDLDTISVKSLTNLLTHSFVIGREEQPVFRPKNWRQRLKQVMGWTGNNDGGATGLCNAVLLSEKNSPFVNRWIDSYKNFRSQGRDKYWNEHSVQVPQQLAAARPGELTILGPRAFHYPLYDKAGLRAMFEEVHEFPEAYLHHLWESFAWEPYLRQLNPEEIRSKAATYNLIARQYL